MPQDIEHYENKFDTIRKTLDNYVKYECTRYNNRATPIDVGQLKIIEI